MTTLDFYTAQEYLYTRNNEQRMTAYGLIGNRLFALVLDYFESDKAGWQTRLAAGSIH